MPKSINGMAKLITIYCGMTAMRDLWDGIDEETRALIEETPDLAHMMEMAETLGGKLQAWSPSGDTLKLIGALEKELAEMRQEATTTA
jgi:hypothetical protein